ncbi:MAG: hypothetical protein AMS16_06305, partial [Planctomycetes bacterium DG_58]
MTRDDRMKRLCAYVVLVLLCSASALAAAGEEQEPRTETILLDRSGFWRCFYVLKPPVVVHDDGRVETLPYPSADTPFPPKTWKDVDFDDSSWDRQRGATFPATQNTWSALAQWNVGAVYLNTSSPALAMIAVRGKFRVTDPARVKGLKLTVQYRGGVAVYLNGREIARKHPAAGKGTDESALAERYPKEAYLYPDGTLLNHDYAKEKEMKDRYLLRTRQLADVSVPSELLRKGTNVVAIELRRAPYDALLLEEQKGMKHPRETWRALWDTCSMVGFRMTAERSEGVEPNVVRPQGVQVWNSAVLAPDFDLDFADPNEPLRPIEVVGTRGGSFSAKVVVGSSEAIRKLRASVSALRSRGGGVILPS